MKESNCRDRILDVASRLFHEQGYNLTGINQIIEEADIARGSLYNHFESKTDLLLAYLGRTQQELFSELEEYLRDVEPEKKIAAFFDFRVLRQQKQAYRGCAFNKISAEISRHEVAVRDVVAAQKNRMKQLIRTLVEQSGHRMVLSDEMLAELIFTLVEGALITGAIYQSGEPMKNAKKIVMELI
jgi:AcrR family transcriptional regulator